jgi:UPF0755 protein
LMQPPEGKAADVEFVVPSGAGAEEIARQLEEKGLVKNADLFRIYLMLEGKSGDLKAGRFQLKQGMTMAQIATVLVGGDAKFGTVTFTVPEGLTLEGIAEALEQQKVVDKQAFLQEADHGTFASELLKEIPQDGRIKHRLEGYLFPDTYEVFQGATAHDVIETMLKQMEVKVTPEMREQMKARGLSLHQALTIASLVEREARVDRERKTISGVIQNRLRQKPPMKLQIDATVQFALGKTKEVLSLEDLKVESPYNTYLHEGLPPGPIASPGRSSLVAALEPEAHEFLYYVTKNDGSGEHYFAKTHEEHLQNINKSQ